MIRTAYLRGLLTGLAALLLAAPAAAAPKIVHPDKHARGAVRVINSVLVRKLENLNFADLSVASAGTAVVDPNTDAMTTTGGVLHIGGRPYAALFTAVSPTKSVVIIRIPTRPIQVTRVGGTETMTVSDWTLSGQSRRTVVAQEPFDFKVGATLYVNANQAEGSYVGTFSVEVQYP